MAKKKPKDKDEIDPRQALPEPAVLPWHDAVWQSLSGRREQLSHALLIHGLPGLGKTGFAVRLARMLLCDQPVADGACGQCRSCQLLAARNHADIHVVSLLDGKQSISIEQIRDLSGFAQLKPHSARRKVTLIPGAEQMSASAANALLKLLEEPPESNTLILVTDRPEKLPVTIRSRCTRITLAVPDEALALTWLQSALAGQEQAERTLLAVLHAAGGAPLAALSMIASGFAADQDARFEELRALSGGGQVNRCASRWSSVGASASLRWLQTVTANLLRAAQGGSVSRESLPDWLQAEARQLHLRELFGYLDVVSQARNLADGPLDDQLLMEDVLLRWQRLTRKEV